MTYFLSLSFSLSLSPSSGGDSSSSSQEDSPQHVPATQDGGSSGGSSCSTPPSSPRLHRSSSASSIDDLLAKDFPQEDLPSLITRTIGKSKIRVLSSYPHSFYINHLCYVSFSILL